MPDISKKLKLESANSQTVRLWPEGTFYKAYERSAYLFVMRLRPYEVKRRYVDKAGCDVVSTGFPQSVLEGLGVGFQKGDDRTVTIRLDCCIDEQQYQQWRDALPLTAQPARRLARAVPGTVLLKAETPVAAEPPVEREAAGIPVPVGVETVVADRIRQLDLAAATPLDCMMMLSELKRLLE